MNPQSLAQEIFTFLPQILSFSLTPKKLHNAVAPLLMTSPSELGQKKILSTVTPKDILMNSISSLYVMLLAEFWCAMGYFFIDCE